MSPGGIFNKIHYINDADEVCNHFGISFDKGDTYTATWQLHSDKKKYELNKTSLLHKDLEVKLFNSWGNLVSRFNESWR